MALEPGLYVAATPIGNLKDVTLRVLETLRDADFILCEDTRHTAKLLNAHGVKTPLRAYHDHNAAAVRPSVLQAIGAGAGVCLVSDAGTPLVADPGYKLVKEARAAGLCVVPLPGPSAVVAALSAAGAPTDQFFFAGFPPAKTGARQKFLAALKAVPGTLVFYETGPRLCHSLQDMAVALGDRSATIARELTKRHEEFVCRPLSELAEHYASPPKGEIVVIVYPLEQNASAGDELTLHLFLAEALHVMSVKDAAAAAADAFGMAKKDAYAAALLIKAKNTGETGKGENGV